MADGLGSASAIGRRRKDVERLHRALPAPIHDRMEEEDVDDDHRIQAEQPEDDADTLRVRALRIGGQREQQCQHEGEDGNEPGIPRAEEGFELPQQRLVLGIHSAGESMCWQ